MNHNNLLRNVTLFLLLLAAGFAANAQEFDRGDTLRGTLGPLRSCYDVTYYDLDVRVMPEDSTISGSNLFVFKVVTTFNKLQFDLFDNMLVDSVVYHGASLKYTREYNAVFVEFPGKLNVGNVDSFRVYYHGKPIIAVKAPWDGGFVWTKDDKGRPWVAVACEGIGASLWWPNKDHLSDEPDSQMIRVTVPGELMDVSNGRLVNKVEYPEQNQTRYDWLVRDPINNYSITVNIGYYSHLKDNFSGDYGDLSLDYYVMDYNVDKAEKQFKQVKPMMACYEKYLGPYPFYKDGYKLVETPYLGMEHQSAIAYGNKYLKGYAGMDFSGIGLDFDYIIIHESGHEWWGNHVSMKDLADMWIHEGFCTYSEAIYVECMYGYDKAMEYVNAKKFYVDNKHPIIGQYGVNNEGDGDMYNKGMLMLNTLRHVINNDDLWWKIIRGLQDHFANQTVTTEDIVDYINKQAGQDYTYFFDQYLRYPDIPVYQYELKKKRRKLVLKHRWVTDVANFHMPVEVTVGDPEQGDKRWQYVTPTNEWSQVKLNFKKKSDFHIAVDKFYIAVEPLK